MMEFSNGSNDAVENGTAAADQTSCGAVERTNGSSTDGENPLRLAQQVCEAMERGEYSQLPILLHIPTKGDNDDGITTRDKDFPSFECQQILQLFYSSIGRNDGSLANNLDNNNTANSEEVMPLVIKAHLLLRALLHPNMSPQINQYSHYNTQYYSLPWEAAIAAIQSIQYTSTRTRNSNNSLSEDMAMVAEIRQFITNLRSGRHNYRINNKNEDEISGVIGHVRNTLECLLELGLVVIAPLLLQSKYNHLDTLIMKRVNRKDIDYSGSGDYTRREHSYVLPLELLPGILASLDSLDDLLADLLIAQQKQQQLEWQHREVVEMEVEDCNDDANDGSSNCSAKEQHNDDAKLRMRYSDKLLSVIYVPFTAGYNNNCVEKDSSVNVCRSIRADSALALLALAIDDIGTERMAMTVPTMSNNNHDDDMTYWDSLLLSICHVIQSTLLCYTSNDGRVMNDDHQQIINEATSDEGTHLISPSDYPALIRCVFRMISTNSSLSITSQSSWGRWESLLLQLYHTAAVISAKAPSIKSLRPRRSSSMIDHRSATLSTVESHVLLPSFTGASVAAIRSVLDSCRRESCVCKHRSVNAIWWKSMNVATTPNWAVAGIVLLIMRARSSNLSNSLGLSSSASFGPRAVFRIASDIMHKAASNKQGLTTTSKRVGLGSDDEIGQALNVLLALRGGGGGGEEESACLVCSDVRNSTGDADRCAQTVLGDTYYAGSGTFSHKYLADEQEKKVSYEYLLGRKTLTQYANLVCSSIYQGSDLSGKNNASESSISETAKTWIDAAYMLLDEITNCESKEQGSSCKHNEGSPNGTAMALTIIVVVFCEVPSSQHDIVRSVYDRLVNSSSRSSDSLKRIASEKYFILVSLLAWALVASYEKNPSLDIVRRKYDMGDEAKAILGPLCNLLTTPAPVYDVFLDTEKPSLSYSALQRLSRSLVSVSSGREAILAMAKKHLRLTPTSSPYSYTSVQVIPFSESMPSTPSAMRDALNFAVDCLCALIEKHHPSDTSSVPDEYGFEAAVMISDIIVSSASISLANFSTPCARVPQVVFSRLLKELMTAVKHARLNEWVSQRILRSCFFATMNFFQQPEGENSFPILMPQRIFRSTHNSSVFQVTTDVVAILLLIASIWDFLDKGEAINSLLKRQILSVFAGETLQRASDEVHGSEFSDQSSADIDGNCITLFLQGVAKAIQIDKFAQNSDVESDFIQQLSRDIIDAERVDYYEVNQQKSSSPSWLKAENSPQVSYGYNALSDRFFRDLKRSGEYKQFYASMCNIVLSTLLRQDEASEFSTEILQCLHRVLGRRYKVCSDKISANLSFDGSNDVMSRRLLDLSSQHLRRLILSKSELPEIDLVARNIFEFCNNDKVSERSSIASVWNFYCSLDEESFQGLIDCIKQYFVDEEGWKKVRVKPDDNFSLLFIGSSNEMEEHVRYFRSVIMDKISKDLSCIATSKDVVSLEDRATNLSVHLQLLLKLCQDWRAGFDGLSGQIGKTLFSDFLETTEKCASAIASSIDHLPSSVLLGIKDKLENVDNSISIVWSIFCEEKLLGLATHLKGTMRLCIETLPQLLRKVEMMLGQVVVNESVNNNSVTLLEQCLSQMKSGLLGDKTMSTQVSLDVEQTEDREFEIEESKSPVTMLNITSDSVEWVYTSVFTAFQQMWGDYYKLISRNKVNRNAVASIGENTCTLSLRKRRRELSLTLAAMFKVFGEIDSSAKVSMIFAEELSHQGKSALCKCMELITMTLISSIKHLNRYFQGDGKQHRQHREMNAIDDIKLRESMICILGWLSSVRVNDETHDIITGPIQWFGNEKERLNVIYARSEDYPVFSRLPKLMYRLEVLEAELRKLVLIVNDSRVPGRKEKISFVDQMTTDLNDGDEESSTLFELLQEYLGVLKSRKKEMKVDYFDNTALGNDGEDAESDLEEDVARKRPKQQFGPRRKRRISLRSRNDTIDNWLALDDDNFASTPGERYNDTDAFVDLEDFIVDG